MNAVKTVFHIHTDYSDDGANSPDRIVRLARERGVGCVAVTDHDTLDGARATAEAAGGNPAVIIGEEVSTSGGHLIGLFLEAHVPAGLSPRDTALAIRRQGGLVVVPHPFNSMFSCGLRRHLAGITDLIDAVEVHNAQNLSPLPNRRAVALAAGLGRPALVGADIHHGDDLDVCYQMLAPFKGPRDFLESLRTASLARGRHAPAYFVRTAWYVLASRTGLWRPNGFGTNCPRRGPRILPDWSPPSAGPAAGNARRA